jgi:hypothetical protein
VFSVGSVQTLYGEDTRPPEWVQLLDIRRRVMTLKQEAEESPLLEAVARKRLLVTWQAGKILNL